jgi:CRISPR system Cascade subunit CasA
LVRNENGQIEKVAFASGVSVGELSFDDPFLAFRQDEKRGKLPIQFKERGLWREFDSLLPDPKGTAPKAISNALALSRDEPNRAPRALLVLGQRNDQERIALIKFWRNERFVFPAATDEAGNLKDNINGLLQKCDEFETVLYEACRIYFRHVLSLGKREPESESDDLQRCVNSSRAINVYWNLTEADFHSLLSRIPAEGVSDHLRGWWLRRLISNFTSGWSHLASSTDKGNVWSVRALAIAELSIRRKQRESAILAEAYEGTV